jgi:hypothetical protein
MKNLELVANGTENFLLLGRTFFSVCNGAMNVPRYWQLRDDACSAVETSANTPRFPYPYRAMNFMAALAIGIRISTVVRDGA